MLRNWWAGVAVGVACALGAVVVMSAATSQAQAQSGFTVSAGQLQINQKISQAAVRRSNRALNDLAPVRTAASDAADDGTGGVKPPAGTGWTADHIADGAVTNAKLANPTLSAVVTQAGVLNREDGALTAASLPPNGHYEVIFGRDVRDCTYVVSVGGEDLSIPIGHAGAARRVGQPAGVFVQTRDADGVAADRPFHLIVRC
jgi:hypothetical protein